MVAGIGRHFGLCTETTDWPHALRLMIENPTVVLKPGRRALVAGLFARAERTPGRNRQWPVNRSKNRFAAPRGRRAGPLPPCRRKLRCRRWLVGIYHSGSNVATNLLAQIERLWANLQGLGVRRLTALAVIGAAAFAVTGLAGYYLSRPTMETLYSGLDRDDIAAIGAALREAGVPFDVNAESTVVLTPAGQTAAARMILAEKGLPRSGAVGNELFDKLGSLGLTSFMQDVTRLRALEGELARTIQMMRTVKAARVHIVLADEGSFRRQRQPSWASVVIRTDGGDDRATGQAIRHLVAAAVPGMKLDDVTVLNVDGRLLASGPELIEKSPDNLLALEKELSQEIRDNVTRTLTPYLSSRNFQISVAARLNADKTQTNETIYNPDSRVERSVRVTKEQQSSQNAAGEQAAGVEANLPKPKSRGGESKQSNDQTQKREELTNYEVSCPSRFRPPVPALRFKISPSRC